MSNEHDALERQLRALTPASAELDREETLYRMGRASVPSSRPWQAGTLLAALLAICLGAGWWRSASAPPLVVERIVEREVRVEVPVPVPTPTPSGPLASWGDPADLRDLPRNRKIEDQLLRHGLDGLLLMPAARPAPRTPTMDELLQSLGVLDRGEP
jgi:hypothetical protein